MMLRTMVASLAVLVLTACSRPSPDAQDKILRSAVATYFRNRTQEAERARIEFSQWLTDTGPEGRSQNPQAPPPGGLIFSTYTFDDRGFAVLKLTCKTCGARRMAPEYFPPITVYCASCGAPKSDLKPSPILPSGLDREALVRAVGEENVKEMYERVSNSNSVRAKVRAVRRVWAFDSSGRIDVPLARIAEKMPDIDPKPIEKTSATGFHRVDSLWIVEQEFELQGDHAVPVGPASEEPVRPWYDRRSDFSS